MESILDKDEIKETQQLLMKEYEVDSNSGEVAEIALSIMIVDNASEELAYREARKLKISCGFLRTVENIAQDLVNKLVNQGVRTSPKAIHRDARRIQIQSLRRMYMGLKPLLLENRYFFQGN